MSKPELSPMYRRYYLVGGECACRVWPIVYTGHEKGQAVGRCFSCGQGIIITEALRDEDGFITETNVQVTAAYGDWEEWEAYK